MGSPGSEDTAHPEGDWGTGSACSSGARQLSQARQSSLDTKPVCSQKQNAF